MENIMSLDEEKCIKILEESLKENLKENSNSLNEVEKIIKHTKRVLEICKKIVKYYDCKLDKKKKKLIFRSAIFHDIAKIQYGEEHNKKAKKILKGIFEKDEDLKKIFHIIEYHKGKFNPESDIVVPAAILRIADKIDKINKNKIGGFVDKYTSSMQRIRKCFEKKDYEKFKETCHIVTMEILIDKIKDSLEGKEYERFKEACDIMNGKILIDKIKDFLGEKKYERFKKVCDIRETLFKWGNIKLR